MRDTISSSQTEFPHAMSDSERLSTAALQFFFSLVDLWALSVSEARTILGSPSEGVYFNWRSTKNARLSRDVLERISYLMGIFKALNILLPTPKAANEWVRKPNSASLFSGRTALDYMLSGNITDLADVRRYLDAERGS